MNRIALAALAAGTMLVATSPSAFADGWQPSSGSVVTDAVNPCTGASSTFTLVWDQGKVTAPHSGAVRSSTRGTYTAIDGSAGTVRTTSTTSPTKAGYTDSYRQVLAGTFEGRAQSITFVFKVVVGDVVDVKVQRTDATCAPA